MKTKVILPAAGKGLRAGGEIPKQFRIFDGRELIAYTIDVFQRCDAVDEIVLAASAEFAGLLAEIKERDNFSKISAIVEGGKERQDSVFAALSALSAEDNDLVAVHDAARPLLPDTVLSNAIRLAEQKGNALVCIKARDTLLLRTEDGDDYLDRNNVYYVQTPQIFRFQDLFSALKDAIDKGFYGTDESMIMRRAGHHIHIAGGSMLNYKVTTADDLLLFERLIDK